MDLLAKGSLSRAIDFHLALGRVELRGLIKEGVIREWQTGWRRRRRRGGVVTWFNLKWSVSVAVTLHDPGEMKSNCAD